MYNVEFTNYASRFLDQCESQLRNRLFKKIEELSIEPFPQGCIKLQGNENLFRIRVGEYRILYSLSNNVLLIYKIDKRSRTYD